MADAVNIIVHGATGKMGREVMAAVAGEPDMKLAGAVARTEHAEQLSLPNGAGSVPYTRNLDALLSNVHADVVIDFSSRSAALVAAQTCAAHRVHLVTGTSGLSPDDVSEMDRRAQEAGVGIMIGPNFSLGATLLAHLAERAAKHFDYVEIIERHHAGKADAPSGSALATARRLLDARDGKSFTHPEPHIESLPGTRGGDLGGVAIHSVRMPGLMAHEEIIFGGVGETLTLRHDTINRECYMPGVLLAARRVRGTVGLTYGLGALLGLD